MSTINVLQFDETSGALKEVSINPSGSDPFLYTVTNSSGSTIAANQAVQVYSNAGTLAIRLADTGGATKYPANAFTTASIANGASGQVRFKGLQNGFSSLTIGDYYVDPATPGAITPTITNTAGKIAQRVGFAPSATELIIDINPLYITQA